MSFNPNDKRSHKFVFVPFCVQCQAAQACGIVKYEWTSTIVPIMGLLLESDVNIIQMPCPESMYYGFSRKPMGITKYSHKGYEDFCIGIAQTIVQMISDLIAADYDIKAILGIELSPTCAANYIYTHHGMIKRQGIFIGALSTELSKQNIVIPIVGLNRRYINKSFLRLQDILRK